MSKQLRIDNHNLDGKKKRMNADMILRKPLPKMRKNTKPLSLKHDTRTNSICIQGSNKKGSTTGSDHNVGRCPGYLNDTTCFAKKTV
jgi:hypothetical protein